MNNQKFTKLIIPVILLVLFIAILACGQALPVQDSPRQEQQSAQDQEPSVEDIVQDVFEESTQVLQTLPFYDDYSNPLSGWVLSDEPAGNVSYNQGGLEFIVSAPNTLLYSGINLPVTDVVMEADVLRQAGDVHNTFGMYCRQDGESYYLFEVTNDGSYRIGMYLDGEFSELTEWKESQAVRRGFPDNRLKVECRGSELSMTINGELVESVNDDRITSGYVGLIAGTFDSDDVEIVFDNFSANIPGSDDSSSTIAGLPFSDDFSDSGSGWFTMQDADLSVDYDMDGFRMELFNEGWSAISGLEGTFDDTIVEVDATLIGGSEDNAYGIYCRSNDNGYYVFRISSDGYYRIDLARLNAEHDNLVDWTTSTAIKTGEQTNNLRADCIENKLTFYVNGTRLTEIQDDRLQTGGIGLTAYSNDPVGTDILFDNFSASAP